MMRRASREGSVQGHMGTQDFMETSVGMQRCAGTHGNTHKAPEPGWWQTGLSPKRRARELLYGHRTLCTSRRDREKDGGVSPGRNLSLSFSLLHQHQSGLGSTAN